MKIFSCPSCATKIKAPESLVGKTVKCGQCKTHFLLRNISVDFNNYIPEVGRLGLSKFIVCLFIVTVISAVAMTVYFSRHNSKISEQDKDITKRESAVSKRERNVEEIIQESIQRRSAKIEIKEDSLGKREVAVKKKEEILARREENINKAISEAVSSRELAITRKEENLSSREAKFNKTVEDAVAERKVSIDKKERDVNAREKDIDSIIESSVSAKRLILSKKEKELDSKIAAATKKQEDLNREMSEIRTEKIAFLDRQAAPLIKPAVVLLQKNFVDAARERFQNIVSSYPGTPTARVAQSYLDKIDK